MKARWSQFVGKLSGIPEKIQQQNALEKRVAYSFSQVLNLTELWAFSTPVSQLWQNPSSPGKLSIGKSFTTPMALLLGAITVLLTNQARFPEILQRSSKLNSHKPEKLLLCKKNFEGTLIPDFLFSILSVTTSQVVQELTEFGRVWFFLYVQNSHRLLESESSSIHTTKWTRHWELLQPFEPDRHVDSQEKLCLQATPKWKIIALKRELLYLKSCNDYSKFSNIC